MNIFLFCFSKKKCNITLFHRKEKTEKAAECRKEKVIINMNRIFRKIFIIAAAGYVAASLTGCAVLAPFRTDSGKTAGGKNAEKTPEVKKAGEILVRAIVENDADSFLRELPENLIQDFGKKDFDKTRSSMIKELGTPVSYTYLRNMAHPLATISIWVIRFERNVKDNKDGKEKTVAMEVLFRVVSGQIQGKETLLSFNFY